MRNKVLETAIEQGRIHLGLGCYINTSDPEKEIRSIFNACSQFWSILTLLTVNKMHILIKEAGYENDIKIISSIYDSIYIHMKCDLKLIKWVNDTIIPLLTTDFLTDTIVPNKAEGEIGFNWYDVVKISNNADNQEILNAVQKAIEIET